jgi:catechol 2,3-dioxygenase-like lactoylglutathione lyase family enzyme
MTVAAFHHLQLTVTDLERSRAFYGTFLGLPELKRPEFPFPGAWFGLANGQELHIVRVPDPIWRVSVEQLKNSTPPVSTKILPMTTLSK